MKPLKYYAAVVFVKNIEASKKFYTEILDCVIEHDFGKNITFVGGLSIWELRDDHIITKGINRNMAQGNKFELYFETEDIYKQFSKLESAKLRFMHKIIEEPWGQLTIRFYDCDNHLIEIGETLKTFVKRMYGSGLSEDKVAEKTGIPVETVALLLK